MQDRMTGLDRLFAKSLTTVIQKNLGDTTTKKVEDRLFEKYGLSITQAVEEFQKLDVVLREFFGSGADGLEKKFLESVCKTKSQNKNQNWINIANEKIGQEILEAFGDEDKTKIMNAITDESLIISDILKKRNIPQTSGYRKINQLIENGLLVADDHVITPDGRKVNKYRALFDNVRINIVKNKITVDVQLKRPNYNGSTILQVICG